MKKNLCLMIILFISYTNLLGTTPYEEIVFQNAKPVSEAVSPIISSLKKLEGKLLEVEVSKLLKKVEKNESPLIEQSPFDSQSKLITFIYKNTIHDKNIYFRIFGIYGEPRFRNQKLLRLTKSSLYYRTYKVPNDLCFSYQFILKNKKTGKETFIVDPINTNSVPTGKIKKFSWSVLDLRQNEKNWNIKKNKTTSSMDKFKFTSKILNNTRNISVYLPKDYSSTNKSYPVIFLFDSFIYLNRVEVPNILDNLITKNKIEPMIAVFIDNPTRKSRKLELTMNPSFNNFVIKELVPHIRSKYNVSTKPEKNLVGGMSYGGLAAAYIAFNNENIFGKVLSQSGSFWREPVVEKTAYMALSEMERTDYLLEQFLNTKKKSLKIYLDWGLQEGLCNDSGRKLANILKKKKYDFMFTEFNGWHDWSNSRKTFPKALEFLLK